MTDEFILMEEMTNVGSVHIPGGDKLVVQLFGLTDVGTTREHNEDEWGAVRSSGEEVREGEVLCYGGEGLLLAVADGMGGMNAGEVASRLAKEAVLANGDIVINHLASGETIETALKRIFSSVHENILDHASANPDTKGMGTTLTLAYLSGNELYVAWCGDSRAYLFHPEGVQRIRSYDLPNMLLLTDDHSIVWDQVKAGKLNPEEARLDVMSNIITQSLGDPNLAPSPEVRKFYLRGGHRLVLCTDGLNSMLPDDHIGELVGGEGSVEEVANRLVAAANEKGGMDNITVIVTDIKLAPALPASVAETARIEKHTQVSVVPTKPLTSFSEPRKSKGGKTWIIEALAAVVAILLFMFYKSGIEESPIEEDIHYELNQIDSPMIDKQKLQRLEDKLPVKQSEEKTAPMNMEMKSAIQNSPSQLNDSDNAVKNDSVVTTDQRPNEIRRDSTHGDVDTLGSDTVTTKPAKDTTKVEPPQKAESGNRNKKWNDAESKENKKGRK